jgi:hypothetical protein
LCNDFVAPPNTYEIDATGPGLCGSSSVKLPSGAVLDIPVELSIAAIKQSVTVVGNAEPPIATDSSEQSVVSRSTILNAPTRRDRVDELLPLIPGVIRGPDGLINMKGARASQGGSLVNSANATDPVTGPGCCGGAALPWW